MPRRQRFVIRDNRKANRFAVLRIVDKDDYPNNERYFLTTSGKIMDTWRGMSARLKFFLPGRNK